MWREMVQTGGNSKFTIDTEKVVKARLEPLTIKNFCTNSQTTVIDKHDENHSSKVDNNKKK